MRLASQLRPRQQSATPRGNLSVSLTDKLPLLSLSDDAVLSRIGAHFVIALGLIGSRGEAFVPNNQQVLE
jgi:hypothetical protein